MSFKHCGRGVCAAEAGHEGTCAHASGWDEEPLPPHITRVLQQVRAESIRCAQWDTGMPQVWEGDQA